ncbi:hypothetical protein [Aeromicrobium sp. UC242_57]|uniref:hypothetical protein n=1 Tax=Aeromicrobium sp. UC242_57 TaxID=3374624 RepID=UPI0037B4595F
MPGLDLGRRVDSLVAQGESVRGHDDCGDLVTARLDGTVETATVEHESDRGESFGAARSASTSAASAICGTRSGRAKAVTSMRRMPARTLRRTSSTLVAVGRTSFSFCSPSRGETSTISTVDDVVTRPLLG